MAIVSQCCLAQALKISQDCVPLLDCLSFSSDKLGLTGQDFL